MIRDRETGGGANRSDKVNPFKRNIEIELPAPQQEIEEGGARASRSLLDQQPSEE